MNGQADAKCCTSRRDANHAEEALSSLFKRHSSLARRGHEVADSRAGHDCERQSTGAGWISTDKPTTACNESCASTNTDRKHLQSATLAKQPKGACRVCPLHILSAAA